jgi:3',5'-cyclic AMP phosphodiesterase CpdA
VRIAHLTDPHVLSLEGESPTAFLNKRWIGGLNIALHRGRRHSEGLLEAAIDDINQAGYDHVIVTGDITNLSLDAEFRRARQLLDRISGAPRRVTVLPGNHDAYTHGAANARAFEHCFADYFLEPPRWPYVRDLGDVAIIAASTAVATPWGYATGRLGPEQLAKVEAALALAREGRKFRLLALHHPPVRGRGSPLRQLTDREALARSLARYGCDLVIHGHEHRDLRNQLPGPHGPIPIYGAPSVTYTDLRPDRRARYNVYTIEQGLLTRVESHDVPRR